MLGGGSSSSGLGLGGGGGSGGGGAGTDAHDEAEEVMARVWAACEDAFVKETERLSRIVKECYPDGAAQVEYEVADVRKPFSANNPSSAGRRR